MVPVFSSKSTWTFLNRFNSGLLIGVLFALAEVVPTTAGVLALTQATTGLGSGGLEGGQEVLPGGTTDGTGVVDRTGVATAFGVAAALP